MAVDGFARALAFAAATAEDLTQTQADLNASLDAAKEELTNDLNTTKEELNTTVSELETATNEALDDMNATLATEINEVESELENKRVKIFDSNIVSYQALSDEERAGFDIAIAAPAVQLEEAQVLSINTMVGDDSETIMNMSEAELHDKLDSIIGGE